MAASAGRGSAGVWRRRDALIDSTRAQVYDQVERGRRVGLFRGTYVEATGDITVGQRELAAVLACCPARTALEVDSRPTAAACLRSAARVWQFPLIDDDDPATQRHENLRHDVTVFRNLPGKTTPTADERVIHRHRLTLGPDEVVRHRSGLWLTSPLRTALDCAMHLSLEAAVCVLDHVLREEVLTATALAAALAERRGWPGVRKAALAVAAADGRSESPAESLARVLLLPHLPGLQPQLRITDERGVIVARADLADPEARLAIEVDGKRWHSGERMVAKDRARDRRLEELGWWTERVTWHDLRCNAEATAARIVARHAQLLRRAA